MLRMGPGIFVLRRDINDNVIETIPKDARSLLL